MRILPLKLFAIAVVVAVGCMPGYEVDEPAQEEILEGQWEPLRTVEGTPLEEEELAALYARLPQLEEHEDDEVDFKRLPDSPPPPISGEDIDADWPPDLSEPAAPDTPEGDLTVQAFRPEGEVSPPFQVAIAFDRPVVSVGAVGSQAVPDELQLDPEPEGRWRWLGTQTLVFEPDDDWPMATEFDITLSDGLRAVDGSRLAEDVRFQFTTPAPEVQAVYPAETGQSHRPRIFGGETPHDVDQPIAVVFNQAIAPESADAISVIVGVDEVPMRLLDGDEFNDVAEDFGIGDAAGEGRVLALAPEQDYPVDSNIRIWLSGPLKSAEGPVLGSADQSSSFSTYGPFEFEELDCRTDSEGRCRPSGAVALEFTTPLTSVEAAAEADDVMIDIEVEPEVDDLKAMATLQFIRLEGDFRPRTEYTITLPEELTDTFGQSLEGDRTITVEFGSQRPFMAGPNRPVLVRPPHLSAKLPVMVGELEQFRARVYEADPDDWDTFVSFTPRRDDPEEHFAADPVDDVTIDVPDEKRHEPSQQVIDLSAAFGADDRGHAIVVIDEPKPWEQRGRLEPRWAYWVQRSELAADFSTDGREFVIDVNRIGDGDALPGADISIDNFRPGSTDDDGRLVVDAPDRNIPGDEPMLVRHVNDTLIVPPTRSGYRGHRSSMWDRRDVSADMLWYVVDDRQTYKPGETVHIRGWIRTLEDTPRSSPVGVGEGQTIDYEVRGPRRNEVAEGEVETDGWGGFEFEFDVPEEINLGTARIRLSTQLDGQTERTGHRVEIQEFRRPEYEVDLETSEEPHLVAEETTWTGSASYFAGGALVGADGEWRFDESSASWRPPNWHGWSFGPWNPWWGPFGRIGDDDEGGVLPAQFETTTEAETDEEGRVQQVMSFEAPERGFPRRVEGTVSVRDIDRQAWEATDSVLVHPADVYVGLRSDDRFISRDEAFELEVAAVDIDGEQVADRLVDVELKRRRSSGWEDVASCTVRSKADPAECMFSGLSPGSYRAIATVEDEAGRISESELGFWVSGRDESGAETAEEDELLLIPDDDEYAVGDRVELMVQAPYYPLDATVELQRDGFYDRWDVTLTEDEPTVEFDVDEEMIPNVHVNVRALGTDDAYDPEHFASGDIELEIDRAARTLGVEVQPHDEEIPPGEQLTADVQVTDATGEPVENAQLLLWAVDESVLALSDYELSAPMARFYPERAAQVTALRTWRWLLVDELETEDQPAEPLDGSADAAPGQIEAMGGGGQAARYDDRFADVQPEAMMAQEAAPADAPADAEPVDVREVFDALAFFRTDLVTDADGRAEITETMPDNLTRYRLMAVAISDDDVHFGHGESDVTARKPLMVSPSAPRFANVGDEFHIPVVVHNRTETTQTVDVGLRATGGLGWLETPGRRVEIPADDRLELLFPARAQSAGTTRIQVIADGEEHSDAELVELPILTPATTEAFATYGTIDADGDDAVLEGVQVPADAHPQFGGLEMTTSSTQLQALTDAFIYLTNYRFNCSEQLASRVLSVLALYDVLDAFEAAELPDERELQRSLEEWVEELGGLQRRDGGFGFWPGSDESHPYASVHATYALWKAAEEGVEVQQQWLNGAIRYLQEINRHVRELHPRSAATVEAYAAYVLARMGEDPHRYVKHIVTRYGIEELPLEALGWLLRVVDDTDGTTERMLQRITNQVQETAATAEFQETYDRHADRILHTTRRTDGVVLAGLIDAEPDHPLVEKVARGLLAHRERGRWSNTQENVFILMALRRYFDEYEDVEPNFIARGWLGDDYIAEHEFAGYTTDRHNVEVPMSFLAEGDSQKPVVLQRDGEGRMYYRLGVNYAPKSRHLPPENQGFVVERNYEPVDDPDDVVRTEDGWQVRAGARVRVELAMTIPARRYHVALVDWLPAGFEPLNPALSVTDVSDVDTGGSSTGWWGLPWYRHQNLRDERVEAFAPRVAEGSYTYSYVARATTPGRFVAMPAKAEEMYHPETFGRSSTEVVTVVDDEL